MSSRLGKLNQADRLHWLRLDNGPTRISELACGRRGYMRPGTGELHTDQGPLLLTTDREAVDCKKCLRALEKMR